MGLDRGGDAPDLLHQLGVDRQPAGGVDDQHVTAEADGLLQALLGHRDRVGRLAEDRDPGLLAEDPELLDGGRALQVGADEQRVATLAPLVPRRQLGGGGGLAGSLQAGQKNDGRRAGGVGEPQGLAAQDVAQLVVDDLDDLLAGVRLCERSIPTSCSRTRDTKSRTTRRLTSACSRARRISRSASSTSASLSRPRPRSRLNTASKRSVRLSNIADDQRRRPARLTRPRPQIARAFQPGRWARNGMVPGEPLIYARGLTKVFGSLRAVDGIDFSVPPGEAFGFLGPNGAGKSSTMRMIAAVSPRSGGELRVLGLDPDRDGPAIRGRLGVVPQEDNLDLELTVRENLYVYGRYFDLPRRELGTRIERLLDFAQLAERADDRVDPLSGGMKRRLTIARSLVNEPDLLLLDEPTTGLDPQARHALWDRLYRLKAEGVTLVLTTHYMDEAEQLCDRLVVMDGGRIAAEGTPRRADRSLLHQGGRRAAVRSRAKASAWPGT